MSEQTTLENAQLPEPTKIPIVHQEAQPDPSIESGKTRAIGAAHQLGADLEQQHLQQELQGLQQSTENPTTETPTPSQPASEKASEPPKSGFNRLLEFIRWGSIAWSLSRIWSLIPH